MKICWKEFKKKKQSAGNKTEKSELERPCFKKSTERRH